MVRVLRRNLLYVAWVVALMSMGGSLFFSEVLPIAIIRKTRDARWYILPLGVIGLVIALYHNLLYYKILSESTAPCVQGVSCTFKFIEWFGFITIPLLSLVAFMVVIVSVIWYTNFEQK